MTAEPIHDEDPRDPEQILARLPERERDQFLRECRVAAKAAARFGATKSSRRFCSGGT